MRAALAVVALLALAPAAHAATPNDLVPPPTQRTAWTARVVSPTVAVDQPWSRTILQRLSTRARWGGGPNQLLVLDSMLVRVPGHTAVRHRWLRVLLPVRPNGTKAWIRADKVQLVRTRWRVAVSVGRREATVLRDGRAVRRFRIVVGAPATPTPQGRFAVSEVMRQADPHGFIGPWALHLTAFSDVLDSYGGGPGRVALHGRDGASLADPLGTARSHGCMRFTNAAIRWLAARLQPGTPVVVGP
jgi:lipoprotein-anchoring transpeptidase ErfK/SrfK